jgi:hypothetical protein
LENHIIITEEPFKLTDKKSIAQLYSESSIIRALVQTIPSFGAIIDAFLAMSGTKLRDERLETFINYLYESIKRLEYKVDDLVAESEEFHDCLWTALESSINSRVREKIIMNVMIISNLLTVKNEGHYRPEEYLKILSDLTPMEAKIIALFYKAYKENGDQDPISNESELQRAQRIQAQELVSNTLRIEDEEELKFFLKRLERTGLIREITGTYFDYTGGRYMASKVLQMLMDYLKEHPFSKTEFQDL